MNSRHAEVQSTRTPRHVAIIMDGNGRWAKQRNRSRFYGHRAGVEAVEGALRSCENAKVEVLTLFAFSSENWRRPPREVRLLMDLFKSTLAAKLDQLQERNVRLHIIGARDKFPEPLRMEIARAEALTANNKGMRLVVAANYGGRWDIAQAARQVAIKVARGELMTDSVTPDVLAAHLSLADFPEPDLFIRTGGEKRLSNFLLWHLAYTEFYFTDTLWPDFDEAAFALAVDAFARRKRRFGRTSEQMESLHRA